MWLKCYSDIESDITTKGICHRLINSKFVKEIYCAYSEIGDEKCFEICADAREMDFVRAKDGVGVCDCERFYLASFPAYEEAEKFLDDLIEKLNAEKSKTV